MKEMLISYDNIISLNCWETIIVNEGFEFFSIIYVDGCSQYCCWELELEDF